jgi:hypothetical protein
MITSAEQAEDRDDELVGLAQKETHLEDGRLRSELRR